MIIYSLASLRIYFEGGEKCSEIKILSSEAKI